jgi:hypothetical protein
MLSLLENRPLTKKEAVMLASRAFALYLICWGLSDVTYLPQLALDLQRHWRHSSVLMPDYWWTYYRVGMVIHLVRILALFAAAGWLLKCGKRVQVFFLPSEQTEPGPAGT